MKVFYLFFAILVLFLPLSPVFAARDLVITLDKTALYGEEELTITASQSGFVDGENIYIKGAFHQDGSTNYFGYTKNNDSWIKNGEATTGQRQIKIGEWDGKLVVKSDFLDTGYKGEGEYLFKIGYYYTTSGGNLSAVNWSNSLMVILNEPLFTPTSTVTQSPTKTPTPATPTPYYTTTGKTITPSLFDDEDEEASAPDEFVFLAKEKEKENEDRAEVLGISKSKQFPMLWIVAGTFFIGTCAILFVLKYKFRIWNT